MPFAAFTMGTIGLSFFFSWLVKAAGGRPLAGLMVHGTSNALIPLFPTIATDGDASQARWWLHQALLLAVGGAVPAAGQTDEGFGRRTLRGSGVARAFTASFARASGRGHLQA